VGYDYIVYNGMQIRNVRKYARTFNNHDSKAYFLFAVIKRNIMDLIVDDINEVKPIRNQYEIELRINARVTEHQAQSILEGMFEEWGWELVNKWVQERKA
jgi:hypothetical protein